MRIDWIGAGQKSLKYMIGGFAWAFVSLSIGLHPVAQFLVVFVATLLLYAIVLLTREAMPKTQEERMEEIIRESIEDTVSETVGKSIQNELQEERQRVEE